MRTAISHRTAGTSNTPGLGPSAPSPTKPLWAVIGVLAICTLAIAASVVSVHKRSAEPVATNLNALRFAGEGDKNAAKMSTARADRKPTPTAP